MDHRALRASVMMVANRPLTLCVAPSILLEGTACQSGDCHHLITGKYYVGGYSSHPPGSTRAPAVTFAGMILPAPMMCSTGFP